MLRTAGLVLSLVIGSFLVPRAVAMLIPSELRCEYRTDPLGIDQTTPRLEWKLKGDPTDARNQKQSAYQIVVASTSALLARDSGDLWDSGTASSDQTNQIVYAGKPLASGQRAFWKVRTWDGQGQPSNWSEPAKFSIGLLQPGDWQAKWIGYDVKTPEQLAAEGETNNETLTFEGLNWMWTDRQQEGRNHFQKRFVLPPGTATRGHGVITADSQFEVMINGQRAGAGNDWRKPQSLQYMQFLKPGQENVIDIFARHEGAGPAGVIGRFRMKIDGQPSMIVDIDSSWSDTKAVAKYGDEPWGRPPVRALVLPPPPFLRKEFAITKPLARATAYASALGAYELHLNGQRVGQDHLTPGWTEYNKRVYYQTYDVTPLLKEGANTIGAILGDGWFASYWHADGKRNLWGDQPRLLVQVNLEYFDGTRASIARAIDTYVSKGGDFVWEPKFTFHGFRYVELSGFNDPPHDAVIGVVAHTPMQPTGSFECSNPLVNQLFRNILWGQKGNYLEVPTDCPQRDERLGWTGDAQFFIPTAAYNFDIAAFFTKWQVDLNEDSVNAAGAFASVAPDVYRDDTRNGATGYGPMRGSSARTTSTGLMATRGSSSGITLRWRSTSTTFKRPARITSAGRDYMATG